MRWEKYHTVWAILIFGWVTNYRFIVWSLDDRIGQGCDRFFFMGALPGRPFLYLRRDSYLCRETLFSLWERTEDWSILTISSPTSFVLERPPKSIVLTFLPDKFFFTA